MAGRPFDIDMEDKGGETVEKWRKRLSKMGNWTAWIIILVIIGFYAIGGLYKVNPSEVGLVKRFGKYVRLTEPGLHYHLPTPVESVETVDIRSIRKVEIGFRTISPPPNPRYREIDDEALILTGDGNIIYAEAVVQWKVEDPLDFAFNLIPSQRQVSRDYPIARLDPSQHYYADPRERYVEKAAEAVLREKIAETTLTEIMTIQRAEVAAEVVESLQEMMDSYSSGIQIANVKLQDTKPPEPTRSAFHDKNSALQDKERKIKEAERYENQEIPRAKGEAEQILNQAEAYKQERIKIAQGDVARFVEVLNKYQLGEDVTQTRLYIETMEDILPKMKKVVLTKGASGVLKFLDLEKLSGGEGQ